MILEIIAAAAEHSETANRRHAHVRMISVAAVFFENRNGLGQLQRTDGIQGGDTQDIIPGFLL